METCSETKEEPGQKSINLITYVNLEGAHEHDGKALLPAIESTEKIGLKPETVLADTAYGSDANVENAKLQGVKVISPVGGRDPEASKLRLADFVQTEDGNGICCPEGQSPWTTSVTKNGVTVCGFNKRICDCCSNQSVSPVTFSGEKAELRFTAKDLRLSKRRAWEQTDEYKDLYSMRSGIEATNSCADRLTRIKNLRYRRDKRPKMAVYVAAK
jgi:hypothetical protein